MKVSSLLTSVAISLLFCAILLVKIHFGSYSVFHIVIVGIISLMIIFSSNKWVREFFNIDIISLSLFVFLIVVLVSYLINIPNAGLVSKTYSSNSGESPPNLYLKISVNGIIFVITAIISYLLGRKVANSKKNFLRIYNALIIFCLINAFANVVAWLISTGGTIGRYNFEPPITFSPGISIQYSSIGFLLGLAALAQVNLRYKKKMVVFALGILLLSILIILTRQSQISFLIMVAWYFYKTHNITLKAIIWIIPSSIVLIVSGIVALYFSGALSAYQMIDSSESVDVAVRLLMLNSAYEIFITNPFFGVGYGMFVGHNTVPVLITNVPSYLASPHNGIASILCELGIAGIILLLLLTIVVIRKLLTALRTINDPVISKYCMAIFVFQTMSMLMVFISNSNLFGPPSEPAYLYISFISWFMIGSVIGVKNAKL